MSQRPFCFHYSKFSCPVKSWIIPRLFLYPGFLFASAELAGKGGGGDVAVNEREAYTGSIAFRAIREDEQGAFIKLGSKTVRKSGEGA